MKNIFDKTVADEVVGRLNKLTPETKPSWGKMNVAQMLAHCNVTYELVYDNKHVRPGAFKKFLFTMFIKNAVVSEKPYKHNTPTAPMFKINDDRDFVKEKTRLIDHIQSTQQKGTAYFDGRESHSFGVLTITEWNNMFYKHIDHHLQQFGV